MAFDANMADAVSGQPASAAEYNKVRDNVLDLNTRVGTTASPTALGPRADALEAAVTAISSGRFLRRYKASSDGLQTVQPSTHTRVTFPTVDGTATPDVTVNSSGDLFTIKRAGIWLITYAMRATGSSGMSGSGERLMYVANGNGGSNASDRFISKNGFRAAGQFFMDEVVIEKEFALNDQITFGIFHDSGTGNTLNVDANGQNVCVTFDWRKSA